MPPETAPPASPTSRLSEAATPSPLAAAWASFFASMFFDPEAQQGTPDQERGLRVQQFWAALFAGIRAWADGLGRPLVSVWFSGDLRDPPEGIPADDSVAMSAVFLARVVQGGFLPGPGATAEEWSEIGFRRPG